MKKLHVVLVGGMALMGACSGSSEKKPDNAKYASECTFPDDPQSAAPLWICDAPVDGVAVSAVGSFPKHAAGTDFQKTQAELDARARLARQFQSRISDATKRSVQAAGVGEGAAVDAMQKSSTSGITDELLVGSRVYRTMVSPNTGTMYVLVGMDPELAKKTVAQAVKSSMNNDQATWQLAQGKKNLDELADDIAKLAADRANLPLVGGK